MKRVLLIILFLLCCLSLSAEEKGVVVEEIGKPDAISIANDRIYITEGVVTFMYDLKTYKYIGQFGKNGEGPGEIKKNPFGGPITVFPFKGKVYVTSMGKFTIFSESGEFEKEYKISPFVGVCYPFEDRYMLMSSYTKPDNKMVFAIYFADKNLKQDEKPFIITDFEMGQSANFVFPFTSFVPSVYKDKIFVAQSEKDFVIELFNNKGKKIKEIRKEYKKIPVTDKYEKDTLNWFRTNPSFKNFFNYFKQRIKFRKEFPPVMGIAVNNDLIYVFTNRFKDNLRECIVMDFSGKVKKTVFLPVQEFIGFSFLPRFTFYDGYFYKLREDVDGEEWMIFKEKL